MDILLLGIYSFFVWLIFIKFKWLPWNITSQVIVVTIPIIALTIMILTLNVVAPSSAKLRVFKFKPKRGYKRRTGHRQELTRIRITSIGKG